MRRVSFFRGFLLSSAGLLALGAVLRAGDDKALKPGQDVPRSKQMFDGTSLSQFVIAGTK